MSTPIVNYQLAGDKESLSDVASRLAQRETPFLDKILKQGKAVTNVQHFWVNRRLVGIVDQLQANVDDGTTNVAVRVVGESAGGIATKYVVGTTFVIDSEYFEVVSIDTSNMPTYTELTCKRNLDSTHAAHTAGARVEIINKPKVEAYEPSENEAEVGERDSNYTQIFARLVEISYTAMNTKQIDAEGDVEDQVENKIKEMLQELERTSLYGIASIDGTGKNRRMGGIIPVIPAGMKFTGSSNAVTVDLLDKAIFELLELGAKPNAIYASNSQKKMLNKLQQDRFKQAQGQDTEKLKNVLGTYECEAGSLPVVRCPSLFPGHILIASTDNLSVMPLQGSGFQMEALAKVGLLERAQAWGEFTMERRIPESHALLHTLATA
jgi:hypothetical protein